MRIIIDCDGAVLDTQPAHWEAYSRAVGELGLARTEAAEFWRIVRTGAPLARALRGAVGRHFQTFEQRFAELLETDEVTATCQAQPGARDALAGLVKHGECILVTAGKNRDGRQTLLNANDLSVYFMQMRGLSSQPGPRANQLRELVHDDSRVVVAASTIPVVRAGLDANLLVVGIANGNCTAQRLTQIGAMTTFGDLGELRADLDGGSPQLQRCGLLPVPVASASPFVTPKHDEGRDSRNHRSRGHGRR